MRGGRRGRTATSTFWYAKRVSPNPARRAFGCGVPCGGCVPIDVIVATPEQAARYRDAIGLIYAPALKEGRVL